MKLKTLWHLLRIESLVPFTGSAILIGFVVTLWQVGYAAVNWSLFVIAVVASLLAQIDAHIWNDIADLEIDRREKRRPAVTGFS